MVKRGADLPAKLKRDAITEALFEIRYEVAGVIPEYTYVRLADYDEWKGYVQTRLPAYEIPPNLRSIEPTLKYQPLMQLTSQGDEPSAVRLGSNVLSFHRIKEYTGWARFRPELEAMVDRLFEIASGVSVTRLGLRYLNAFNVADHGIGGLRDLHLDMKVADEDLTEFVNLNYLEKVDGVGDVTVRIATPNFVNGSLPKDTTVFVDVDIGSASDATFADRAPVKEWLVRAHDAEKRAFFHLLKPETVARLKER